MGFRKSLEKHDGFRKIALLRVRGRQQLQGSRMSGHDLQHFIELPGGQHRIGFKQPLGMEQGLLQGTRGSRRVCRRGPLRGQQRACCFDACTRHGVGGLAA